MIQFYKMKNPIYKLTANQIPDLSKNMDVYIHLELRGLHVFPYSHPLVLFRVPLPKLDKVKIKRLFENLNEVNTQYNELDQKNQIDTFVQQIDYIVAVLHLDGIEVDNKVILRTIQLIDIILADRADTSKIDKLNAELHKSTMGSKRSIEIKESLDKKRTKGLSRMKAYALLVNQQLGI